MKNFIQKSMLLFTILFAFVVFPTLCHSNETITIDFNKCDKVYFTPNDLFATESGLYLTNGDEVLPLRGVFADENGPFILVAKKDSKRESKMSEPQCSNGHPLYHLDCNGCATYMCKFKCMCFFINQNM